MLQILFVDDEQKVLDGFRRSLRPLRREWSYAFAQGGTEALKTLEQGSFDVVVTDMRMPGINGMELLRQVRTRHPNLLRIVLSGQSEMETLVRSSGVSHQYLAKPCPLDELKMAIDRAFSLKRLLSDPFLVELASKIDTIPSVSPVYQELKQLLQSPLASTEQIGSLIAMDMGMCAKVLQVANSGCFARMQFVSDPICAASLLGTSGLQGLLFTEQAICEIDPCEAKAFDVNGLWRHSLQCSRLAQAIAGTLDEADDEMQSQAGVAGLLHDVGKLLMGCSLPEQYKDALELSAKQGLTDVEAERLIFQTSHAELGAYVMTLWNIPDPIVEAIAYHHHPTVGNHAGNPVLTAVYAAELLLSRSTRGEQETAGPDPDYLEMLGLTDRLQEWQERCCQVLNA